MSLREAAQALIARLEEMEKPLNDLAAFRAIHGMPYTGPNWGEPMAALKAALAEEQVVYTVRQIAERLAPIYQSQKWEWTHVCGASIKDGARIPTVEEIVAVIEYLDQSIGSFETGTGRLMLRHPSTFIEVYIDVVGYRNMVLRYDRCTIERPEDDDD